MKLRPLTVALLAILVFVVVGAVGTFLSYREHGKAPPRQISRPSRKLTKLTKLKTWVRFDGRNFEVTNDDDFTWHVPKFTINAQIIDDPYVYQERYFIAAGETKAYPAREFANSKGQRFDPWTMKPMNFTIECDLTSPLDRGHYFAKFR